MTKVIIAGAVYAVLLNATLGGTVGGIIFAATTFGIIGLVEYNKRARTRRRRAYHATIERPTIDL